MRPFHLYRHEDVSGISGVGVIAEGVQFEDGVVVIHWRGDVRSTAVYNNVAELTKVHGHEGRTEVRFVEP